FECADGAWITLSIAHEDAYWARLAALLGLRDLAEASRPERTARRAEIKARIAEAIRTRPRADWEAILEAGAQMWGPANRLAELPEDPHVVARGLMARLTRADGAAQWVVRQPVRFSAYENAPLRPAPILDGDPDAGFDEEG
ncbi:MAG: CoA transferase, partial [Pseudomonadota bacterium]